MIKKCTAILLALVLVLGFVPAQALAIEAKPAGIPEKAVIQATTEDGFTYQVNDDHVAIIRYNGTATKLIVPDTIEGLPVTEVSYAAFEGCRNLQSIFIPKSITYMTDTGSPRFGYCSSLTEIIVDPDNPVYSSMDGLLLSKDRTRLHTCPPGKAGVFTVPDYVTYIECTAFYTCDKLTEVVIGDHVTAASNFLFHLCSNLTSVTIGTGIRYIPETMFGKCDKLEKITFCGDRPSFDLHAFGYYDSNVITATVYYPADNQTWAGAKGSYGGNITWVPYDPESGSPMPDPVVDTHDTIAELTDEDYWVLSKIAYWDFDEYFGKTMKEALTGMGKWNKTVEDTDIKYSELCEAIGHWRIVDVDNYSSGNGFYGVTFANGDDAVVAYRGSIPLTSTDAIFSMDAFYDWVCNDLYPILLDRVFSRGQYDNAKTMYENAAKGYTNIAVTGHSLGGGLANLISAHYGCRGVSMNAISILDAYYTQKAKLLGSSFAGVDKWNFVDHANQYDALAGSFEAILAPVGATKLKPVVAHTYEGPYAFLPISLMKLVEYHGLESYITRDNNGNPSLTKECYSFTPDRTISNFMGSIATSIDLGTSNNNIISNGLSVAATRVSYGGDGQDTISTSVWGDTLIGGRGYDELDGGWGSDAYLYYKGDGVDTIHDIGGNDWLVLLGFTEDDTFSVMEDPGSDYIRITNGGKDIVRISKKNREYVVGTSNRFKIVLDHGDNAQDEIFDITDAFYKYTSGEHLYIGCPVHVEVLDSNGNVVYTLTDGEVGTWYTDYGNFYVFEEENGEYGKVLDLVEGYTARIVGAGEGTMDVTYQVPVDGELTEPVSVSDVPVTEELIAAVEQNEEGDIYLIVDSDGDGETDSEKKLYAECPFTDVKSSDYYYEPVRWAVDEGITSGTTPTEFSPYESCLRSQVVTFLWRAAGEPKAESKVNPFVDVKPTDYYYDAVLWAVEKGITTGADATHFEPNGVCNRSQVVTFLYRAFGKPPVGNAANPFTDVKVGAWYADPVLWAVNEGITNGLSETKFGPNEVCNRSQVVTFLYRAYE